MEKSSVKCEAGNRLTAGKLRAWTYPLIFSPISPFATLPVLILSGPDSIFYHSRSPAWDIGEIFSVSITAEQTTALM
jgi:hypothetical protein